VSWPCRARRRIRAALPSYGFDDFRATFQFSADTEALFRKGAERIGLA
jgi:hypothetical protein